MSFFFGYRRAKRANPPSFHISPWSGQIYQGPPAHPAPPAVVPEPSSSILRTTKLSTHPATPAAVSDRTPDARHSRIRPATELTSTGHDELRRCWIRDAFVGIPHTLCLRRCSWRWRPPLPASTARKQEVQRLLSEMLHQQQRLRLTWQ